MNSASIPKTGFAALKAHWKDDLQAGFGISLIALPLCLGIAAASNFPPIAGLFAAIVGGLLVSRVNGSFVTITGPAAGLIVVNLSAVEALGEGDNLAGYHYALAAIVVAGIFIFLFGLIKAGKLGDFFPSTVVHGMLAAIGIIIMSKEVFKALGTKPESKEILEIMAEIPDGIIRLNPEIAFIAIISLGILIVHPKIKSKFVKLIPGPMWVLIATIPLAHYFDLFSEHGDHLAGHDFIVGPKFLVNLPDNLLSGIVMPDFGKIASGAFWIAVTTIALVTGIETLLSAVAVDSLDPFKRKSNLNRDISAMGIGASASAFIGGLPMISEIVRSTANVNNGAKTQWSNFFHAGFLLVFLLVGKDIIQQIPLAALSAMLIFTGFRLASPKEFKHVYELGISELLVFVVTIIAVLATDLLIGIGVGIVVNLLVSLVKGTPMSELFHSNSRIEIGENETVIYLSKSAVFSNYLGIKRKLIANADKQKLVVDFTGVHYVDHTVVHHLSGLKYDRELQGKELELRGLNLLGSKSHHPLAERTNKIKVTPFENKGDDKDQDGGVLGQWADFHFMLGRKINRLRTLTSESFMNAQFVIADLNITEGARLTENDFVTTALKIHPTKLIPEFSIRKEKLFDKLKPAGHVEIEGNSEFDKTFFVTGNDPVAVRKLFTNDLISLFLSEQKFEVESNGESMLIVGEEEGLLEENEMKEIFAFVKTLFQIISKR